MVSLPPPQFFVRGKALILGWVNMYQMFDFFTVFIICQAHLRPSVLKQANFLTSLQNSSAEIDLCATFFALRCDKAIRVL